MTRKKQNRKAKEDLATFERTFWKRHNKNCPSCRAHFAKIARVFEGRDTTQDLADILSTELRTIQKMETIRPRPTEDIEDAAWFSIYIGNVLTIDHAYGRDIRGPIRQAFSWMNVFAREKLLLELINGHAKWWHPELMAWNEQETWSLLLRDFGPSLCHFVVLVGVLLLVSMKS